MKIARVFPRRTKASPVDALAFYDEPGLFPVEADQVHVSVTFTYDIPRAERLAKAWERVAQVTMGGPAMGAAGGDFTPGMYLKPGYVITSRGCPNWCWFCSVPKREGDIRELPITEGYNVLDDNLLACSEEHIRKVFAMLKRQRMGAGGVDRRTRGGAAEEVARRTAGGRLGEAGFFRLRYAGRLGTAGAGGAHDAGSRLHPGFQTCPGILPDRVPG